MRVFYWLQFIAVKRQGTYMAMVNVKLYGKLRKFGREFKFDVHSKREVIDALSCQIPGFKEFILNAERQGLAFAIFEDKKNLSEDDIALAASAGKTIRIAPIIMGSKSGGLFQVILGAVLIGAAFFTGGLSAGAGAGLAFGAKAAAGIGVALIAGGISQMLSPSTKLPKGYEQDGNVASYGFGGAITTTAQGNPVPLIYGRREVGGACISAGIYAESEA